MKILLTGSNGFLGGFIYSNISNNNIVETLGRENCDIIFDLAKSKTIILDKYDLVIHAAGKAHFVPKFEHEKDEFFRINVNGTLNLLNSFDKLNLPKYFVFISSVSVYGKDIGVNIKESSRLDAMDSYGKSKIAAEEMILNWCTENNILCTILRLPLIVGSNPPGNLGALINSIRKGYYFNISKGSAKKSMVLASDVSKFILAAAEVGGIYNLTDGCHPKFNELSHLVSKQLGKRFVPNMPLFVAKLLAFLGDKIGPLFPINSDKLSKITSTLTFDDSKARKAFGWNPTPVLKGFNIHE